MTDVTKHEVDYTREQLVGKVGPLPASAGLPCAICIAVEKYKHLAKKAEAAFKSTGAYKAAFKEKVAVVAAATAKFNKLALQLKAATAEGREWNENEKLWRDADESHPQCKACGLAAGGMHHAQLNANGYCLECAADMRRSPEYAASVKAAGSPMREREGE